MNVMEVTYILWKDKKLALILFAILGLLFGAIKHYSVKAKLANCELQCSSYKNELVQLKIDSKTEKLKYKNAYDKAKKDVKKAQEDVNKILYAKVPTTCDGAMKWAVNQSKDFDA